jgi:dipeptidyl aminopeptidase/acylaminoacyl peptidase
VYIKSKSNTYNKMFPLIAILVVLLLFLSSVTLILFFIGPTILLQPRRRHPQFYQKLNHPIKPSDLGLSSEEISFATQDGIKLNGWLIKHNENSKGTIVYLHGVGDSKIAGLPFAKFFYDNGYNIFLYDSRRHGESEGTYCTYGFYEKKDLTDAINYLESRKDLHSGKIGVFGTSMGAAVALQTAAIDKRISAVAAENSFEALRTIFDDYQKRIIKIPFHYLRNIVIIRSEINAKFKAREVSPLKSVDDIKVPVLFVYGTNDIHINYKKSIMLYECAGKQKEIYPIEHADHNNCWDVGGEKYHAKLLEFFGRSLL